MLYLMNINLEHIGCLEPEYSKSLLKILFKNVLFPLTGVKIYIETTLMLLLQIQ